MKLLAIGGAKHGEWLPYREGQRSIRTLVQPDMRDAAALWRNWGPRSDLSFTSEEYVTRVIADRLVWVCES